MQSLLVLTVQVYLTRNRDFTVILPEGVLVVINSIKFLFPMLCLIIILTACSKTENTDKRVRESTNDSTIEKSALDYTIVNGKIYHILVDEYFKTNDENNPNVNVLYREYKLYDGNRNNVYSASDSVSIPKEIESITEAKEYLQSSYSEWLRLKPLTIISEKVISQWKSEGYQGEAEYWSGSPKGLTLEKIIQDNNH